MGYIQNLLKELIVTAFLFAVLYVVTPRFIKIIIKQITKSIYFISNLVIQQVWKGILSCYEISTDNKKAKNITNKETKQPKKAVGSENYPNNVVEFRKR